MLATPLFASADTVSDLQAQIQALLVQLTQLKTQMGASSGTSVSATSCLTLTNSLSVNATDADNSGEVSKLQQFLAQDSSIYPENKITGYFGPATLRAVQRWQKAHGIVSSGTPDTTGYGFVGARTRAAMACQTQSVKKSSILTSDQIQIISPADTLVSVGGTVKVTYKIGSNIVPNDPAVIERSIINASTNGQISGYVPISQSAGQYAFDWIPSEPGKYTAEIRISHNNTLFSVRSGIVTVVGEPISSSNLLTPNISVSVIPASVAIGQSALLSWDAKNANKCALNYGSTQELIAIRGSKTVTPSQSTTYTVWCANDPGTGADGPSTSNSATLAVTQAALQTTPSCSITATSPGDVGGNYLQPNLIIIRPYAPVTFTWTSQGASSAKMSLSWITSAGVAGSSEINSAASLNSSLTISNLFHPRQFVTIAFTGSGGSKSCTYEVAADQSLSSYGNDPHATFDSSSLQSSSKTPTITGSAENASNIVVHASDNDPAGWGWSQSVTVVNGRWSVTLPSVPKPTWVPYDYNVSLTTTDYALLSAAKLRVYIPQ